MLKFPLSKKEFERFAYKERHSTRYKTASGEVLEDHGKVQLFGSDVNYTDKTMTARVTDVHRILASGSEVCRKNLVVLNNAGGEIIPASSSAAKKIQSYIEKVLKEDQNSKSTKLRNEGVSMCLTTGLTKTSQTRRKKKTRETDGRVGRKSVR